MLSLSVCTPWQHTSCETLSRLIHHSFSVYMLASKTSFVLFSWHWLLGERSYYSNHWQDLNWAQLMSDVYFVWADDGSIQGSICSLGWLITAEIRWKSLFSCLSPLNLDEKLTSTNDTARNHTQTKARMPPISLVANNMAAVGVTVSLFLVTLEMKTFYYYKTRCPTSSVLVVKPTV